MTPRLVAPMVRVPEPVRASMPAPLLEVSVLAPAVSMPTVPAPRVWT